MTFTPVEIIALIVIIAVAIKMIVLGISPKSWMNFVKKFFDKTGLVRVVSLVLAGTVLYYLIQEGITIVQILSVTTFISMLILVGLAPHIGLLIKNYEAQTKKSSLWKENWLYILIWILLLIWGAIELFNAI